MALGVRFQKLRGRAEFSEGQRGAKFSEDARFLRATMFFSKHFISEATLLLIIHISMYILISLIQQNPQSKTIMALFSHTTIKCCFGRKAYSKFCIIVYLSSCSALVEECMILMDCLFDIALLL